MSRIRSLGFVLLVSTAVMYLGPVASSQQAGCGVPGAVTPTTKDWDKIAPPRFFLEPQGMRDFAIDPLDPSHLFVTNNKEIMESKDGGCKWASVYQDPTALRIDMEIPVSGTPGRVILVVTHAEGVIIEISEDWGQTWSTSADSRQRFVGYFACRYETTQLYEVGFWSSLVVAPSDAKTMYLCLEPAANRFNDFLYFIFASTDGGITWEQRSDSNGTIQEFVDRYGGPFGDGSISLFVDPIDAGSVWALGQLSMRGLRNPIPNPLTVGDSHSFLKRSTDGARTWNEVKRLDTGSATYGASYSDLVVRHDPGSPASLTLLSNGQPECQQEEAAGCLLQSSDSGTTWNVAPSPTGYFPLFMEPGRNPDRSFVVTPGIPFGPFMGTWVHRYDFKRRIWVNITPPDNIQDAWGIGVSKGGKKTAFFVFGGNAIDRFTGKV